MLKLEKIAKTLEISITLRKNERFLNKSFVQALLIAVGLHLFAGVFFNVRLSKVQENQQIFPPALVESDLSLADHSVIALLDLEEILPRHVKEPKGSKPSLPAFPSPVYEKTEASVKPCEWNCRTFKKIHSHEAALVIPLPENKISKGPAISLQISGDLGKEELIYDLESLSSFLPERFSGAFRKSYFVQLENRTGELFWYHSSEEIVADEWDEIAEQLLKSLTFVPREDAFITEGLVEIIIHRENKV